MGEDNKRQKNHEALERLVEILQDKKRTAISTEGTWVIFKIGLNPETKKLIEELVFETMGWEDAWYKLDWGRVRGNLHYNVSEFYITGNKVCAMCQDKVVMGANRYCLDCSVERRKEQNREAKRKQRKGEK